MSGSNAALVIAFDARIGNLESQLRRVQTSMRQVDQTAKNTQTTVANAGRGIGTAFAGLGGIVRGALAPMLIAFTGGALVAGIAAAVQNINALADAAAQVGLNTQQYQTLQIALEEAGGSAETAGLALGRLSTLVGDASRGVEEAQKTFAALGISYRNTDGSVRSTEEAFNEVSAAIRNASSEQEKLSIAADFFGQRAARQVVAALAEMDDTLAGSVDRWRQLGVIVGPETADRLDKVGTAFANLGRVIVAAIADAVARVGPYIVALIEQITEAVRWAIQRISEFADFARRVAVTFGFAVATPLEQANVALRNSSAEFDSLLERRRVAIQTVTQAAIEQNRQVSAAEQATIDQINQSMEGRIQAAADRYYAARAEFERLQREATPPGPSEAPRTGAPPVVNSRGGRNQELEEALRKIQQLVEQTRAPLEQLGAQFDEVAAAIARVRASGQQTGLTFEVFARQAEAGSERTARALKEAGASTDEIIAAIRQRVTAYAEELVRLGQITADQVEGLVNRAAQSAERALGSSGSFLTALQEGLGFSSTGQKSFEEYIGLGIGQEISSAFDELSGLLEEIATGAKDAGEAITEFAIKFAQAMLKVIAQAAALQAVQAVFSYLSGGGPTASPLKIPGFGGAKMAGGSVSGGYTYLVGERGPELFTAPGPGNITPNNALAAGGTQVTINNNAPGVIVEEQRIDERTVIMSVNMARQEVARDFRRSVGTGFGPYAEPLSSSYNVKRRL